MQTALRLKRTGGIEPVIIEREEELGGKVRNWHVLFPTFTPAGEVLGALRSEVAAAGIEVLTGEEAEEFTDRSVKLRSGRTIECDAVALCSGFTLFDATLKEEYGAYASTSRYRQRILLSRGARYDSNPKLRKRLGEYFEDLTLYVQAQEVILHTADSKNFITNMNQLIKKTEEKIKLRETPMK